MLVAATPFTLTEPMPFASLALPRTVSVAASVYDTGVGNRIRAAGGVRSKSHWYRAGDASTWLLLSVARTAKLCTPTARPVSSCGLCAAANAPPSTLTSKVAPGLLAEKVKVAEEEVVALPGPLSMAVSGAPPITVHWALAGVVSVL